MTGKELIADAAAQLVVGVTFFAVGLGVLWLAQGRAAHDVDHDTIAVVGAVVLLGAGAAVYAVVQLVRR